MKEPSLIGHSYGSQVGSAWVNRHGAPGLPAGLVTGDTDDAATVLDDELRTDAREVLADALQWRFTRRVGRDRSPA